MRGLYAVTPDIAATGWLLSRVRGALEGGARFVQYRNKAATAQLRREQGTALMALCQQYGASLIVNDHVDLAVEVDAAGVHLGAGDSVLGDARQALGESRLIGISCYNRVDLALAAQADGADYVAFGSFFSSSVKPAAVHAPLEILTAARTALRIPVVAIGGITPANAAPLIEAGADAVAVISALFTAEDVAEAARCFGALFDEVRQ